MRLRKRYSGCRPAVKRFALGPAGRPSGDSTAGHPLCGNEVGAKPRPTHHDRQQGSAASDLCWEIEATISHACHALVCVRIYDEGQLDALCEIEPEQARLLARQLLACATNAERSTTPTAPA